LGSFLPFPFGEAYLGPDLEAIERTVQNAVAMKVDLASVASLEKTEVSLLEELANPRPRRADACLHLTPPAAHVVVELAPSFVERVVNSEIDVLMRSMFRRRLLHDELSAGNGQVDAHMVYLAFALMSVRGIYNHPTSHNPIVETVQLQSPFPYRRFDAFRRRYAPKCDLQRKLH
jgi:hypothetical protein